MRAKALEIRDEGTFIAALAVEMHPGKKVDLSQNLDDLKQEMNDWEARHWLLRRCGYLCYGRPNILVTQLDGNGKATNDPYAWGGRTWPVAHNYIIDHWAELRDGDVVDVSFILGETTEKKVSERVKNQVVEEARLRYGA